MSAVNTKNHFEFPPEKAYWDAFSAAAKLNIIGRLLVENLMAGKIEGKLPNKEEIKDMKEYLDDVKDHLSDIEKLINLFADNKIKMVKAQ